MLLGSTVAQVDSSGNLGTSYTYDPYGNTSVTGTSNANEFQYTGRENEGNGLYFYRARYYSAVLQRFVSEDPLQFDSGDVNFYAYVWNSPTNWVDPMGLRPGQKYPNLRCAGWHAIWDINTVSRHRTPDFPNGREYGGWIYRNPDGTYSYVAPAPGQGAEVDPANFVPIPAGTAMAGNYHTHAAYDPDLNSPNNPHPGQPGYNWNLDGNEVFSGEGGDKEVIDGWGTPGFLGTPQGTTEEYIPRSRPPARWTSGRSNRTKLRLSPAAALRNRREIAQMLRTQAIVLLLATVLITATAQGHKERRDYVPDEKTAVRIAEAILVARFGEERVKAHLPLHGDGSNKDYWIVEGSRPQGEAPKFGGGPAVWINKHSGCILNVIEHTK